MISPQFLHDLSHPDELGRRVEIVQHPREMLALHNLSQLSISANHGAQSGT